MKEYLISMNDTIYGTIDNYVYLHLSLGELLQLYRTPSGKHDASRIPSKKQTNKRADIVVQLTGE